MSTSPTAVVVVQLGSVEPLPQFDGGVELTTTLVSTPSPATGFETVTEYVITAFAPTGRFPFHVSSGAVNVADPVVAVGPAVIVASSSTADRSSVNVAPVSVDWPVLVTVTVYATTAPAVVTAGVAVLTMRMPAWRIVIGSSSTSP